MIRDYIGNEVPGQEISNEDLAKRIQTDWSDFSGSAIRPFHHNEIAQCREQMGIPDSKIRKKENLARHLDSLDLALPATYPEKMRYPIKALAPALRQILQAEPSGLEASDKDIADALSRRLNVTITPMMVQRLRESETNYPTILERMAKNRFGAGKNLIEAVVPLVKQYIMREDPENPLFDGAVAELIVRNHGVPCDRSLVKTCRIRFGIPEAGQRSPGWEINEAAPLRKGRVSIESMKPIILSALADEEPGEELSSQDLVGILQKRGIGTTHKSVLRALDELGIPRTRERRGIRKYGELARATKIETITPLIEKFIREEDPQNALMDADIADLLKENYGIDVPGHTVNRVRTRLGIACGLDRKMLANLKEIRDTIQWEVDHEYPDCPITDSEIIKILNAKGLAVTKQTVGNNRRLMGIPGSRERHKQ
jgi:hypothetical protein